jgi:hypothetical protein
VARNRTQIPSAEPNRRALIPGHPEDRP